MKLYNSQKSIDSHLSSIIEEAIKSVLQKRALQEKEKQEKTSTILVGDDNESIKKNNVTIDNVVEKLNSIRSGKSFTDKEIFSSLSKYFENLKKEEQLALFAFLKGISQIVTGEIQPSQALSPSNKDVDIKMTKTVSNSKVSIKPTIIKASLPIKKEKPAEDASGPVPIVPKSK